MNGNEKMHMVLENKILMRLQDERWLKYGYEIVKYSPDGYDSNGCYQKDEWTSIADIGCSFHGQIFTFEEYVQVEDCYVNLIMEIIKVIGVKYLTVGYLESSSEAVAEWYSKTPFKAENARLYTFAKTLHQGQRISMTNIPLVVKLCLRECLYAVLVNLKHNLQIDFGYDYYMHIHTQVDEKILQEIASRNKLFVNPRS